MNDFEERHLWRMRPDSRDADDESSPNLLNQRRCSQESTESEKYFRKKYQTATYRMVYRKSSGEFYKRMQTKCFGKSI